jgi:hypothetical protein
VRAFSEQHPRLDRRHREAGGSGDRTPLEGVTQGLGLLTDCESNCAHATIARPLDRCVIGMMNLSVVRVDHDYQTICANLHAVPDRRRNQSQYASDVMELMKRR